MAEKLQIAIVGLGLIGTSAGLALRRFQEKVVVVGHDRDPARAGKAKQMGAVERTEWNLINTVRKADRVLLAIPAGEIRETLEIIAQDLKPGCIILDMADVKAPVLQWAAELLPENVHFVGGHPIVVAENTDTAGARADLFDQKQFCLIAGQRTPEQAFNLALDLVHALGAQPFFVDALEHDGMTATVEHLPVVMAGALMSVANGSPSWNDMRKLAGSQFYGSTWVALGTASAAGACLANQTNVVRQIDALIAELEVWREKLVAGDKEGLEKKLEAGLIATDRWVHAHNQGNWEETPAPSADMPTSGSYMRQMIGFGGMGRQPGKPKK